MADKMDICFMLLIFMTFLNNKLSKGQPLDQALRKEATQSSTFKDFSARRAVDGRGTNRCLLRQGSVSCTQTEADPWLKVNLGSPIKLARIEVTSRAGNPDGYSYLGDFILLTGNNSDITTYVSCGSSSDSVGNGKTGLLECTQIASWVALRKINGNTGSKLCICDLKVIGSKICPSGRYGLQCNKFCSGCKDGACDSDSGECLKGCNPGKLGARCNLNCNPGFYGDRCKYSCPVNCDTVCVFDTGACRCKPGYTGVKCDLTCPPGSYGQDCKNKCSDTCEGGLCSFEDGFCPRCVPGYEGDKCLEQCTVGYYGVKCRTPCPEECPYSCHTSTGACLNITTTAEGPITSNETISTRTSSTTDALQTSAVPGEGNRNAGGEVTKQRSTTPHPVISTRGGATPTVKENPVDEKLKEGVPLAAIIVPLVVILVALSVAILIYVLCRLQAMDQKKRIKQQKAVIEIEENSYSSTKMPGPSEKQKSLFTGFRYYDSENDEDADKLSLEMNMNLGNDCKLDKISEAGCENEEPHYDSPTKRLTNEKPAVSSYHNMMYGDCDEENDKMSLELNMADFSKEHAKSQAPQGDNEIAEIELKQETATEVVSDSTEAHYENLPPDLGEGVYDRVGCPIKVEELLARMVTMKEDDEFVQQFNGISKGKQAEWDVPTKTSVKHLNEFECIIPYDHNRVVLENIGDDPVTDYINASFVKGYEKNRKFIAAQGATKNSVGNFLRMLWEKDINVVVVLITLEAHETFIKFWPSIGEKELVHGDVKVETIKEDVRMGYSTRTLMLAKDGVFKEVQVCEFTNWTEGDTVSDIPGFLRFREDVLVRSLMSPEGSGPVVVQCNTGSNRTGVYLTLDYLLEQASNEHIIDVMEATEHMRESRIAMVPTIQQFKFIYEVLLEALHCGKTSIAASEFLPFLESLTESKDDDTDYLLVRQHNVLDILAPSFTNTDCISCLSEENKDKNRTENILAPEKYRPKLLTEDPDGSNYINAVFVDSHGQNFKFPFIATQSPMKKTVQDFWRLVDDYSIRTIVALNSFDDEDDFPEYWCQDLAEQNPLKVTLKEEETVRNADSNYRQFIVRTIEIQMEEDEPLIVKQFQICNWMDDAQVPSNSENLLAMLRDVLQWQEESGAQQFVVHCPDGALHCGVFCAIAAITFKVTRDKVVDVFHAVKQIRQSRPHFIRSFDQYQFLYHATADFINSYSELANRNRISVADCW